MPAVDSALVVGGGVAGTTAAIELQRAGIRTHVVELEPVWAAIGHGVSMMAPALRALDALGLLDDCLRGGFGVTETRFCDADGTLLESVEIPRMLGPERPSAFGMMRPELHRALSSAATAAGATVQLGTTVAALAPDDEGVAVELTDGTRARYDLVVGADGFHSRVRALLLGDAEPRPRVLGQAVLRALVPRPPEVTAITMFYGHDRKTGFTPLTQELMYCFLVQPIADRTRPEPDALPELMRSLLRPFGGVVARTREAIVDPDRVDFRVLEALLVDRPWHRGRVALIGDAVHTTTPQLAMGAAMALEDGIVLARELAADTSVAQALERFEERRFGRCRLVVDTSVQLSEWEKAATDHEQDSARLMNESMAELAGAF